MPTTNTRPLRFKHVVAAPYYDGSSFGQDKVTLFGLDADGVLWRKAWDDAWIAMPMLGCAAEDWHPLD